MPLHLEKRLKAFKENAFRAFRENVHELILVLPSILNTKQKDYLVLTHAK